MTTLQEAARKALEALETCSYGDYSAKHVVDPSFDGDAVEAAIESLNAALAQQELPQKARPDFMAGYDAGMADAKRMAQQGEQQPVCYGCGIPVGDVHMSTCKSGKWPSRVSNGDTAAPAPQAQEPHVWMIQGSHGTWKGEHAEMDAKAEAKRCGGTCYAYPLYTQPAQMRILTDAERAVREKARDK